MPAGSSYIMKDRMLSKELRRVEEQYPFAVRDVVEEQDGVRGTDQAGKEDHAKGGSCYVYRFGMSNQFLHAVHPLGFLKKLCVKLDGEELDPRGMYFILRGQWFHVPVLHTVSETFWRLAEEAQLLFCLDRELPKGYHTVECVFTMSMLEDTRILDKENKWPDRVESVSGKLLLAQDPAASLSVSGEAGPADGPKKNKAADGITASGKGAKRV